MAESLGRFGDRASSTPSPVRPHALLLFFWDTSARPLRANALSPRSTTAIEITAPVSPVPRCPSLRTSSSTILVARRAADSAATRLTTCMVADFRLWLLLVEHDLNPADYDALFDRELARLLPRISSDSVEQARLRGMIGTNWTGYIAAALRNAGFRDQASLQEKIHDVVVGVSCFCHPAAC